MAFSIYQLLSIFLEYKAGEDEYEDLKQYVTAEIPEETETAATPDASWENQGQETEAESEGAEDVPSEDVPSEDVDQVSEGEVEEQASDSEAPKLPRKPRVKLGDVMGVIIIRIIVKLQSIFS